MEQGRFYHIYNRGNSGENLFKEDRNYYHFLHLLQKYIEPVAAVYAYCLLPNHFHLLLRIRDAEEQLVVRSRILQPTHTALTGPEDTGSAGSEGISAPAGQARVSSQKLLNPSRQFAHLFNAYTKAINLAYDRTGSLFEKNFHRKEVTSQAYYTRLICYIHQNPQRHGLVTDFTQWPHSSYHSLLSDKPTRLHRHEVINWFGSQGKFAELHRQLMGEAAIKELIIE